MANFKLKQASKGAEASQEPVSAPIEEPRPVQPQTTAPKEPMPAAPAEPKPMPKSESDPKPIEPAPAVSPQPKQQEKAQSKSKSQEKQTKQKKAHEKGGARERKALFKKKEPKQYENAEAAYKDYKTRKTAVFVGCIVLIVGGLFFGLYNTFFRHEMTPTEAAIATNNYNSQMKNQKWDSGIQSYLEANLQTLMQPKFVSSSAAKSFSVSDAFVERNQPVSDTMFLTFFDCKVTVNGSAEKLFCYIFINTEDQKMQAASDVSITSRQAYSADAEVQNKNEILDFDEKDNDSELSKSFQNVLDNFLTLGYNLHQDTSNIYKGSTPLAWGGKYGGIVDCKVYKNPNKMGFNAVATYTLEEDNGFKYTTKCYMQVEKQDKDTWIIKQIM